MILRIKVERGRPFYDNFYRQIALVGLLYIDSKCLLFDNFVVQIRENMRLSAYPNPHIFGCSTVALIAL